MGKRKSSRVKQKAPRPKLDTVFDCPFCNHKKTVEVNFEAGRTRANISCRVCAASWSNTVSALTEPIDLYSEWIDECQKYNP